MAGKERSQSPSPHPPAPPAVVNPFAVSQVGLGKLDFLELHPGLIAELSEKLETSGWRGQLVGPHGSGKTTLTIALAGELSGRFRRFSWLVVEPASWFWSRPRSRVQLAARASQVTGETGLELVEFQLEGRGELLLPRLRRLAGDELCFVDGIELLPAWRQRQVLRAAADRPVVWTTHRRLEFGPSVLRELQPDLAVFSQLVGRLLRPSGIELEPGLVAQVFRDTKGDFRRGFSQLYDYWESQRRRPVS